MSMTQRYAGMLRRIATQVIDKLGDRPVQAEAVRQAARHMEELERDRDRLQRILDSRPAINAGLPETYIQWSQQVYETDIAQERMQ